MPVTNPAPSKKYKYYADRFGDVRNLENNNSIPETEAPSVMTAAPKSFERPARPTSQASAPPPPRKEAPPPPPKKEQPPPPKKEAPTPPSR